MPRRLTLSVIAALLVGGATAGAQAPQPGQGTVSAPPLSPRELGGFRMEGAADVDVVFGDATRFRGHIDRFYAHHQTMQEVRSRFATAIHSALGVLSRERRGCPTASLARVYARAKIALDDFRSVGTLLEAEHVAIARLDDYGETGALTPDYRFRVAGARGVYQDALVEFREMRVAFEQELGSELRYRRCDPSALVRAGTAEDAAAAVSPTSLPVGPVTGKTRIKKVEDDGPAPERTRATFFVDNRDCQAAVVLHLDGAIAGRIEGGNRGVFQASTGRHALCLIPADSDAECGTIGTLRTAYLHNGFRFSMSCAAGPPQPRLEHAAPTPTGAASLQDAAPALD